MSALPNINLNNINSMLNNMGINNMQSLLTADVANSSHEAVFVDFLKTVRDASRKADKAVVQAAKGEISTLELLEIQTKAKNEIERFVPALESALNNVIKPVMNISI